MREVYIAGAAMTAFGKDLPRTLRSYAEEAVELAVEDAGTDVDAIEAVFFANATAGLITGQEMIRGQVALRHTGLLGLPLINVENACASGSSAFHLACLAVASRSVDVAIAVGAEKMSHEDKTRTFEAFGGGVDLEEFKDHQSENGSLFMELYAGLANDYSIRSGATPEDYARVAVKSHANAAKNPKAQYRSPVCIDEVLESRVISSPLTLLMCSPVGDGAAAVIVASKDGLARLNADPVTVLASSILSARNGASAESPVVTRAAQKAYAEAGVGPGDVDVVELHDAAAPAELIASEELGLVPVNGGGVELLRSGESELGGRIPVNPSGGLLSKGHPVGATGCAQIVEIADQLRRRCGDRQVEAADIGLAENGGGWLGDGPAVAAVTILRR